MSRVSYLSGRLAAFDTSGRVLAPLSIDFATRHGLLINLRDKVPREAIAVYRLLTRLVSALDVQPLHGDHRDERQTASLNATEGW